MRSVLPGPPTLTAEELLCLEVATDDAKNVLEAPGLR
jgi:hypothetical protein